MFRKVLAFAVFAVAVTAQAGALCSFDIDDDGKTNASTDGVLALRYMLGFRGQALINGVVNAQGMRTDPTAIETFLANECLVSTPAATGFSAKGIYAGNVNGDRTIVALITDDAQLWGVYTQQITTQNPNPSIEGFFNGQMVASGNAISSSNTRDFNFAYPYTTNTTVSGSFSPGSSLNASTSSVFSGANSVATTYSSLSSQSAILSQIAGSYVGNSNSSTLGFSAGAATISATGAISSTSPDCSLLGTIVPRVGGNHFDVTVTFGEGRCAYPLATMRGVAIYVPAASQIIVALLNRERNTGFLLIGQKQ
jgi:hypothetical protein